MMYYLVENGSILSGPHAAQSHEVKLRTSCGNPELLDLTRYGYLPEVREALTQWQVHGAPVVESDRVFVPVVDRPIGEVRAERIAQINYEAGRRIESVWPLWAQSNAALGVYPESDANACRQWIEQHIDASNTATARVNAATTAAEIDAVVVAWPEAAA
jgi:hypothetical protein